MLFVAIAVLSCIMGCQKNNVVEETNTAAETKGYRFSKSVGFQENENELWYEMTDAPVQIKKDDQTIIIEHVVWMDGQLICDFHFENVVIENIEENFDVWEKVKIYSNTFGKWMEANAVSTGYDEDKDALEYMQTEFKYKDVSEEVKLSIFDEEYTIKLTPFQVYNSLEEIGNVQTFNGRSIIVDRAEDQIKVYTYSNDIWKIEGLNEWTNLKWTTEEVAGNRVFIYKEKDIESVETIDIEAPTLEAECEDVMVTLPIPKESEKVDIPFKVGEDTYRVTEVRVVKEPTENMTENERDGLKDNILLYVNIEPVQIEENTEVFVIQGSLYTTEEVVGQSKNDKGEVEMKVYGTRENYLTSNWYGYFVDENFEITEPVLEFYVDENVELPEEVILKIELIRKKWTQPYHFGFDS